MVTVVAHCDWSIDPKKRWMCVAIRDQSGWTLSAAEPVGDTSTLIPRLRHRARRDGALLIGFDFPIGLPEAYGSAIGLPSFREALLQFGTGSYSDWFDVAEHRSQVSLSRPFYPMRPGGTQRKHLFDGLGMPDGRSLQRRCERATPTRGDAAMLFWTLGGNQVGKAALTGWKEIILPNLGQIALWPFDGRLATLVRPGAVIAAETYPGDVYARLGIPRRPVWSKRKQSGRSSVAHYLTRWLADHSHIDGSGVVESISEAFGCDRSGEDRFDAMVGLFGMLDVIDGNTDEGALDDPAILTWEGWILGQGEGIRRGA